MKVAVFSTKKYDEEFFTNSGKGEIQFNFITTRLNEGTVPLAHGHDAVCLFVNDLADRNVITRLAEGGTKFIALRCAGFNNVDLEAAAENGITVCRVPAYSPQAVAEHAVALILTLNRKTHRAYNRVREGNFELNGLLGFDLYKKTVGVVGTGKIGQSFIDIMKGFGCKVIAYDPYPNDSLGIDYASLPDLLSQSDIVSLHCPLTKDTHHLFNEDSFSSMKRGAMLINTGRGALIDTQAAIKALKERQLGYLGLDVYEEESSLFFDDHSMNIINDDVIIRLMSFPTVLITGHQGFFTNEALSEIANTTVKNLKAHLNNDPIEEIYLVSSDKN